MKIDTVYIGYATAALAYRMACKRVTALRQSKADPAELALAIADRDRLGLYVNN